MATVPHGFAAIRRMASFSQPFPSSDDLTSLSDSQKSGSSKTPSFSKAGSSTSEMSVCSKPPSSSSQAQNGSCRNANSGLVSPRLWVSTKTVKNMETAKTPKTPKSPKFPREDSAEKFATEKALEAKYRDMNYFMLARMMRNEVYVKDRVTASIPWRTVKSSFRACDATKYLVKSLYASTTAEAQFLCEQLISQGHIYDAVDELADDEFCPESKRLFRFATDDRTLESLQIETGDVQRAIEEIFAPTLKAASSSFEGRQLVTFLLEQGHAADRSQGLKIGQLLLEEAFILRVGPRTLALFRDSAAVYRLARPLQSSTMRKRADPCGEIEFEPASLGVSIFGHSLSSRRISLPSYAFEDLDEVRVPSTPSAMSRIFSAEPRSVENTRLSVMSDDRMSRQPRSSGSTSARSEATQQSPFTRNQSYRTKLRGAILTSQPPTKSNAESSSFLPFRSECQVRIDVDDDDYRIKEEDERLTSLESEDTSTFWSGIATHLNT